MSAVERLEDGQDVTPERPDPDIKISGSEALLAPPKDQLMLPGITYDAAFEVAREGSLAVEVRPIPREEALHADEMWLSSSTKEILAVTKVDGQPFAGGRPGPVFRKIYALFQASKLKAG